MRILQVTRQFAPSTGGLENAVQGLSGALQKQGHEVNIVTLRRIFATGEIAPEQSRVEGLAVTRIPHWGIRRYPIAPGVLKFARSCDIVHIHAIDFFVDYLSLLRFRHKRPIVVTTHGGIFHTKWMPWLKSAYFRTATRESLKHVDAVVSVSEHDYELFAQIVPEHKLHLIRNGVEVEPYLTVEKKVTPGLLVGIGRVAPNKGVDLLIRAIADIRRTHEHVRLVWIGQDDCGGVPALKHLAKELGVGDNVEFTGRIDIEVVKEHLSHANLFVSASNYEGFGLSTLEAMSSGTVPVVTKVGIHPQVIDHGKTGFLVDPHVRTLSEEILASLELDDRSIATIGASAREVSIQYAWSKVVAEYLSVYQSAMHRAVR
jgi:alpha-1,3-mannosyltransferase